MAPRPSGWQGVTPKNKPGTRRLVKIPVCQQHENSALEIRTLYAPGASVAASSSA